MGTERMSPKVAPTKRVSMGTQILIGVIAGVAVGIFLGELSRPFETAGRIYVNLLQMTVLPYIVVSLISKIGNLTLGQAKVLGGRSGLVMLLLWALALATVVMLPFSLPVWESGSFFTASLVETPPKVDFIDLYIPKNPFWSLSENIVPAVVLFSILIGVALIGLKEKARLLDPLKVVNDALSRITHGVVLFSPYGTFALAAGAAGMLSPDELVRLAGYVSTNTVGVILLTFVVLPGIVSVLTPYSLGKVIAKTRGSLLTAFATGKLFAVLTMVHSNVKEMMIEEGAEEEEAESSAGVANPLGLPVSECRKDSRHSLHPFRGVVCGLPS